jgi:hypothetical protein
LNDTAWHVKAVHLIFKGVSCRFILRKGAPVYSTVYSAWQLLIFLHLILLTYIRSYFIVIESVKNGHMSGNANDTFSAQVKVCSCHPKRQVVCFVFNSGTVSSKPDGNTEVCSQPFYRHIRILFMTSTKLMAKHADRGCRAS